MDLLAYFTGTLSCCKARVSEALGGITMYGCMSILFFHDKGEERTEDEGGRQFFFDQKSLDVAEKKRRQQERRGGKRFKGG